MRAIRQGSFGASNTAEVRYSAAPMQAGSTAKAMMSASESIWMPYFFCMGVRSFLVRATLPSNASHRPENSRHIAPR